MMKKIVLVASLGLVMVALVVAGWNVFQAGTAKAANDPVSTPGTWNSAGGPVGQGFRGGVNTQGQNAQGETATVAQSGDLAASAAQPQGQPAQPVQPAAGQQGGYGRGRGGNSQGANGAAGTTTGQAGGNGRGRGAGGANTGQGQDLGPLTEAEAAGLVQAIEEEYGAQALYESILAQFGDVYPFNTIAASEQKHAEALINLANKYGVTVPEYTGAGQAASFSDLSAACSAGVEAEQVDAALYDELLNDVTHADLMRVYQNLQSASLTQHLPAFESCQ